MINLEMPGSEWFSSHRGERNYENVNEVLLWGI